MRKVFGKGFNFAAQINSARGIIPTFQPIEQLTDIPIKSLHCGYLQTYFFLQNGQTLKIGHIMDSLLNIRQINLYRLAPSFLTYFQKLSIILGKNLSFKGGHDKLTTINGDLLHNQFLLVDAEFSNSRMFLKDSNNDYHVIGENYFGQLGTHDNLTLENTFRKIAPPKNEVIKSIKCGFQHTVVITETGNLYGFGKADSYQIQPMDFKSRSSIVNVTDKFFQPALIWKGGVKHAGCGFKHTIFSLDNNELYGLGNNKYGQAGQNYKILTEVSKPTRIYFPLRKGEFITDIKCGFNHSLVLTNFDLYFFGCTEQNQNPFEKYNQNLSSPARMKLPFRPQKIFANFDRTAVIGSKGECVFFGGSSHQKIGGPSGQVQDLSKEYTWTKESLVGLGFGHTIIRP